MFKNSKVQYRPTDVQYSTVQYRPTKWIKGFDNWKKLNDSKQGLPHHFDSNTHKECVMRCEAFLVSMSQDLAKVIKLENKIESKLIEENRTMLGATIEAIKLCGKHGIPLRGHREQFKDNPDENKGVFLGILDTIANYNPYVKSVLEEVKKRQKDETKVNLGASMTSPRIQNELIQLIGRHIQSTIVHEVIQSGFYVIISDETTLHNRSFLTVGIRYVNQSCLNVKEETLMFREMEGASAEAIFNLIISGLHDSKLPIEMCVGACFDGAAVMSGHLTGVAARLKEVIPHAVTMHCYSHKLSLCVLSKSKLHFLAKKNQKNWFQLRLRSCY